MTTNPMLMKMMMNSGNESDNTGIVIAIVLVSAVVGYLVIAYFMGLPPFSSSGTPPTPPGTPANSPGTPPTPPGTPASSPPPPSCPKRDKCNDFLRSWIVDRNWAVRHDFDYGECDGCPRRGYRLRGGSTQGWMPDTGWKTYSGGRQGVYDAIRHR